jgi:hypothetical protein
MAVLPKRFEKYGLTLHPDKTRVIRFQRPPRSPTGPRGEGASAPGTFDLLGFTHYWGRSRKASWVLKRKTASKRLTRALKRINLWCREHRHAKLGWQHQKLALKVRGHYGYYGIAGNFRSLTRFREGVLSRWRKWLGRRSQRSRIEWERFTRLQKHYLLPKAKIVHGIPST